MTTDEARQLMESWTQSPALRAHMEAVAACMAAYAAKLAPEDTDRWVICGILHDFDYEKHPTPAEHPFVGVRELESRAVAGDIRTAILGHAQYSGIPRQSAMAKTLFAVDELAGFIVACCKVRPDGVATLEPRSVKKKLKDKSFAAAVSRDDIRQGAEELAAEFGGLDMDAHIAICIEAIRAQRERIGV